MAKRQLLPFAWQSLPYAERRRINRLPPVTAGSPDRLIGEGVMEEVLFLQLVDNSASAGEHTQLLNIIHHRFGCAEEQISVRGHGAQHILQDLLLVLIGKIDKHIPAKYNIECAEGKRVHDQVMLPELNPVPDIIGNTVILFLLLEIFVSHFRSQPTQGIEC